ncbi:UNVERIFIED_CONTAM: hypothetical protein FKN15_061386 [Acipenser sinensis]
MMTISPPPPPPPPPIQSMDLQAPSQEATVTPKRFSCTERFCQDRYPLQRAGTTRNRQFSISDYSCNTWPAKPQPRERAWQNQRGKKTLLRMTLCHQWHTMCHQWHIMVDYVPPVADPWVGIGFQTLLTTAM